ncbi:MAG: response regulator [Bacteroidota bacterium]
MKANKPSYVELENQVADLKEELVKLSLLLNVTDKESRAVLDSLEIEKEGEYKSLNSELVESVFQKVKTPLDTIVGLSKLLSTANLDFEERNNLAEIIANCSNEIQGVFSEFVSYNSLKSKKEVIEAKALSLNELLDDLKIKFVDQVFYKGLNFRSVKGLSDDDDTVLTDGGKLTHVLTSLLNNSLKFTHKGFIEMGYKLLNDELKFYVKDSGVGLDKSLKEKLVDSQLQIEKVTDEGNEVGLGLATVKRYVDLLGGSLKVESELGVGTLFSFKVPYVPAPVEGPLVESKKTIKVLIADDEEISFMLLKKLMEKGDVKIIRAKNGEEAYEIYKKNPDINLILMDLRMPQVDGYVAAQLIKNEAPDMPIIAQSAYSLKDNKESYGNAFNGYLSKPVSRKEFELAVNKYIDVTLLN